MAFDFGDTFTIENPAETGKDIANISMIKVDEDTVKTIDTIEEKEVFTNETINLTGTSNIYFNGNKYEIKQNLFNKKFLKVLKDSSKVYELADAAQDATTANYIVTESVLTKDAGTIKSGNFKISGNDINVNGHKGLIIDGGLNIGGTTVNTGIYGAVNSNITIQNNGILTVNAEDKQITIGNTGEIAISLNNGIAILNANNNGIVVNGAIRGNNKLNDLIGLSGNSVTLNQTDNVTIATVVPNVILNGIETNTNWIVNSGMLNILNDNYLSSDGTNSLTFNGCGVNLINGAASDINLASLTLNDKMEAKIDVDIANLTSDRFVFNNSGDVTTNGNRVEITGINILNSNTALTNLKYEIPFASSKYNSQNLVGNVDANIYRELLTPIYKYSLSYNDDGTQGVIAINRLVGGGYNDFNPSVFSSSVGAQAGSYLSQINGYETAFANMDMLMAMPNIERNALKYRNKYAFKGDDANIATYNPNQTPEEQKGVWFRPYATFENINLKNGPKVENIGYGSYFGGDTNVISLKHGWDAVFSGYAGYNGSHQHYDGVSIYQNGGQLGATALFYKNNLFSGLTVNAGASQAEASAIYGRENFTMLTAGIASKTGYNFGFKNDKFIIQPSWLMSYSFINTFDYTNAAGVKIDSYALHAIQLVPGVKFIWNLPNNWQPYIGAEMVWNIMDKTNVRANDVNLEQVSVKPYIQYGVGLQKRLGETFTGFLQAMIRNGGRNGIALTFGFRWAIK